MNHVENPAFPRGLIQPEGSARFGLDALLLAAFVRHLSLERRPASREPYLELGSGSGAACIALGLCRTKVMGVEKEQILVEAARHNLEKFALEEYVLFHRLDLGAATELAVFGNRYSPFSLIFANPPWYEEKTIRASPSQLRKTAHSGANLAFFCGEAEKLLEHHGFYCLILPPQILPQFMEQSRKANLGLRQILPVASHRGEEMKRLLILCQKNAANDLHFLSPLHVHDRDGSWSREITQFCPWLPARTA